MPVDGPVGIRHGGGESANRALVWNVETCNSDAKGEIKEKKYTAQIRYHGEFLECKIKILEKNKIEVIFKKPVLVAGGQSIVVYDKEFVLLGGVVV